MGTTQMDLMKLDFNMEDKMVDVDYLMENVWIVGDPNECADKIRELYEEVGGFGTLLSITVDSDNVDWDYESLRLLAEKVGPQIEDIGN